MKQQPVLREHWRIARIINAGSHKATRRAAQITINRMRRARRDNRPLRRRYAKDAIFIEQLV